MAPAAGAMAHAFLAAVLLILPMLGINAFAAPSAEDPAGRCSPLGLTTTNSTPSSFPRVKRDSRTPFLEKNCWYAVSINAKQIAKLKYIVAYRVAPLLP